MIVLNAPGKVVTFTDSIFIGSTKFKDPASVVFTNCQVGDGVAAKIPAQKGFVWEKLSTEFDSAAFRDQGFSSTRWSK